MRTLHIAILLLAPCIAAQAQGVIRPGAKVRIEAPGIVAGRTEGTILSATADSLVIAGPALAPLAVSRAMVSSIEVSGGRDRWMGTKKGTVIGAGWGLGLGMIVAMTAENCTGSSTPRSCTPLSSNDRTAIMGVMTYVGAFYGAIIGAIAGRESWTAVDLPARTAIELTHDGRPALSLSASF